MGCCNGRREAAGGCIGRSELAVKEGVIRIIEGDISQQTTDAIVNSTNDNLSLDIGEARAIMDRAGVKVLRECITHVNEHGPVDIAETVVTSSGGLKSSYVIHVSSPVYIKGRSGEPENLRKAVINALDAAESLECKSVAVPAISAKSFDYPKAECTLILVRAARVYLSTRAKSLQAIHFVTADKATLRCFKKALERSSREDCILDSASVYNPVIAR